MKKILTALVLMIAPIAADAAAPASMPDWITGAWEMQDGSAWADETWSPARGDLMIGAGREGFGNSLRFWEMIRIARKADGTLSYLAQPRGGPVVEFSMVNVGEQSIEFANPAHDYPQRIRYWREGNLLMAETSKMDGSDAQRWNYRPMGQ
jgi:opacity protein-like surface antigen